MKDDKDTKSVHTRLKKRFGRLAWIVIAICSLVFVVIMLLLFRLNFMIGEQLRISITPEYRESTIESPGAIPFTVETKLYNKYVCEARCQYTLTDISSGVVLDSGSFSSKAYKDEKYSKEITLDSLGYGVKAYLYRIECSNERTTVCPSYADPIVRKSLLVVNYHPSDEQMAASRFTQQNFDIVRGRIENSSVFLGVSQQVIEKMPLPFDRSRYDALSAEMQSLQKSLSDTRSAWDTDDYILAKSVFMGAHEIDRSLALVTGSAAYNTYIADTVNNHNLLVNRLSSGYASMSALRHLLSINALNFSDEERKQGALDVIATNRLVSQLRSGNYSYTDIDGDITALSYSISSLDSSAINVTGDLIAGYYPALYVYSNMFCLLESRSSSYVPGEYTACGHDYDKRIGGIDDAKTKIDALCADARYVRDARLPEENMLVDPGRLDDLDSSETLLLEYKLLIDYESIYGGNEQVTSYRRYIADMLKLYGVDSPEGIVAEHKFNLSLLTKSDKNILFRDISRIAAGCNVPDGNASDAAIPALVGFDLVNYAMPAFGEMVLNASKNATQGYFSGSSSSLAPSKVSNVSNVSNTADAYPDYGSSVKLEIPQLGSYTPRCCIYGWCQPCDKGPENNPLILLHGHSFNKDTHAYQSIDIFDEFDRTLAAEGRYFESGILLPENSTQGILGVFGLPVVTKPTYYLETYNDILDFRVSESKTGNIDTYALRLKESIDYTKYVTGSDKVDIVAHSMGGLVVRRYMQVFGTESLGKVILIGTPNNGIGDRTYSLCKLFGSKTECDDMKSGSIFIKKLNDMSNQPDMEDLYLVIGTGCETDGKDGDGVVAADSVLMKNVPKRHILYVNGTCSGASALHGELLNVGKYPQVYEFVKSTLDGK